MSMAASRAGSGTLNGRHPFQFLIVGRSAGVSADAALVAIVWIPAQSVIVAVSCARVRRKRAMHRVLRRALGCRGDAFRRRLRPVVARHRSILRYRRILGSGGYRHEDGQGKGKSKRTSHDDFPLGRALLTTNSTYWIADNGCQLLGKKEEQ